MLFLCHEPNFSLILYLIYRYPWVTTRSNFVNRYRYTTPYTPTVSPYRVVSQYTTPVFKKTQSTAWKKQPQLKTTRYVNNNINNNKIYRSPPLITTTAKSYIIHNYVKTHYRSTGYSKANYPQSKVTYQKTYPYKYKSSASSMSYSSASDGNATDDGNGKDDNVCRNEK